MYPYTYSLLDASWAICPCYDLPDALMRMFLTWGSYLTVIIKLRPLILQCHSKWWYYTIVILRDEAQAHLDCWYESVFLPQVEDSFSTVTFSLPASIFTIPPLWQLGTRGSNSQIGFTPNRSIFRRLKPQRLSRNWSNTTTLWKTSKLFSFPWIFVCLQICNSPN